MNEQNQLFLKLFILYIVLFGGLTLLFNYAMGFDFDLKSASLFILVAAYLSFRRSRKINE